MQHSIQSPRLAAIVIALAGLTIAGCAAPPPAPIIGRTIPGAPPPRPAVPAAAPPVVAPSPVAVPVVPPPAPPEAAGVETAPIRSGGIESRTIDGQPLPGAAPQGVTPSPGVAPPSALPPGTMTEPRAVKAPYSDGALADMRAAEQAGGRGAQVPDTGQPGAFPPTAVPPAAAPSPAIVADGDGPWSWPTSGRVLQSFDQSANRGIALDGKLGDPVHAAADGRVIFSGAGPRGYGNLVIVKHDNDLLSVYAHNRVLVVKEGQNVKRGQRIAEVGDSGTNAAKLHFEIRQQGRPVDPMKFLPRR